MNHIYAMILAYMLDLIIGDPKTWPHPVRWLGSLIHWLEGKWNRGHYRYVKGGLMLATVIVLTLTISLILLRIAYGIHPWLGILIEAIMIASTIAQKSLIDASMEVYQPLERGALDEARRNLSEIVGRDTEDLDEGEIVRATVETVAENTGDGITAPLFWAVIGGAPLALLYRAVNTCDSMVGYRNDRYESFGWASAKLDDLLNYIPARMTAWIMLMTNRPRYLSRKQAWIYLGRDAKKHSSPNSGWLEAAAAYILSLQLGGINFYQKVKKEAPIMGSYNRKPLPLTSEQILHINQIVLTTSLTFTILVTIGGVLLELTLTRF